MSVAFFFVSTPQHLLMASAYATSHPELNCHLLIIDQKQITSNPINKMIESWPQQPFSTVNIFPGKWRGFMGKVPGRKQVFTTIARLIDTYRPSQLFTGADKRLEFQFSAHYATQLGLAPICTYIDEGTITYSPYHPALHRFSERILSKYLKRMVYGSWWDHPLTYGASCWINNVMALFPDLIAPGLKEKSVSEFPSEWFSSPEMQEFTKAQLTDYSALEQLKRCKFIFTLPHHSLSKLYPGYIEKLSDFIADLEQKSPGSCIVKLHPRSTLADFPDLGPVQQLPASQPFELFLPFLNSQTEIYGDLSSTLHTARWVLPEAKLFAINPDPEKRHQMATLYDALNIEITSIDELTRKLAGPEN